MGESILQGPHQSEDKSIISLPSSEPSIPYSFKSSIFIITTIFLY